VDVGGHQDGLVHVSALANRFVSDPREVVKSGQVVRVKVLEADPERKRISLTLRLDDEPAPASGRAAAGGRQGNSEPRQGNDARPPRTDARSPRSNDRQPRSNDRQPRRDGADAKRTPPKPALVNTAMAEALRKAGLGK
jgi:uncharacterized protein